MEFIPGDKLCSICGHSLGVNNTTGVGYGCNKHILQPAMAQTFYAVKGLEWYVYKANKIRNLFVEVYSSRKFRNEFKKSFFASMQTAERISKKQLGIMEKMLFEDFYGEMKDLESSLADTRRNWVESFNYSEHLDVFTPIFDKLKVEHIKNLKAGKAEA